MTICDISCKLAAPRRWPNLVAETCRSSKEINNKYCDTNFRFM